MWFLSDDPKLSAIAKARIEDSTGSICISPATYWEMAIKVGIDKLDLIEPFDRLLERGITGNGFEILPIAPAHAIRLTTLPRIRDHKDPFDRMLIAQALVEGIPLIGCDVQFDAYGITRIW